jgi:glycosyltransferase involved in cell wall biosynthesis
MRILIATPLYPPDLGNPAPYVKELASRLSLEHEVTVLAFTRYPEKIEGVRIVAVSKRQPLVIRMALFTIRLFTEALRTDVIIAENGSSVELPVALVSTMLRKKLLFHVGDERADAVSKTKKARGVVTRFAQARSHRVIENSPLPKPEILPLEEKPVEALNAYETSWNKHVSDVTLHLHA